MSAFLSSQERGGWPSPRGGHALPVRQREEILSGGKLGAGPNAGRYFEGAVALGREGYYAGEGERPGRWVGSGADALQLDGEVEDDQVVRLMSGEDPKTGDLLGRPLEDGSVAG